jgi:hypothetical protein
MGHIGDGDPDDMAAGVLRIVIGMGVDRVVPVARIGRVDGDERQVAQVLAPAKARGFAGVRLRDHGVGEGVGNAVFMDRDQADGLRRAGIAQPLDDPRAFGRPMRPFGPACSASTSSPSRAPWVSPARTCHSRSAPFEMGTMRPPSAPLRNTPRIRRGFVPMRRIRRATY